MEFTMSFDPVTRIEGHMRIEIKVDRVSGVQQVVEAKAAGALFRGFERILIGRDPRDAQHITERICGVCPTAHGLAAVRCLEDAFGSAIPDNARILRNLCGGANFLDSHILHFYLLALPDYMEGPAMPPWQADWKVDRRFGKAQSDTLLAHYLQAVEMHRKAHEMGALFGGKVPHPPAFLPGGITTSPRQERIDAFRGYLDELLPFIRDVYLPDVELLAETYPDYYAIGRGSANLLAFGAFDEGPGTSNPLLPAGIVHAESRVVENFDHTAIREDVAHSWFDDADSGLNPAAGRTQAQHPKAGAYSWLKAPRLAGKPFEVGPLARMWVSGDYQRGVSTMDRHRARATEALKLAEAMLGWLDQIDTAGEVYSEPTLPASATGMGLTEAGRGALGHWCRIEGGVLAGYQVITPTAWNASPRDDAGVPGPIEESLLGIPVADADQPIEVMRVIRSFDPCLDCATHVLQPGKEARVHILRQ